MWRILGLIESRSGDLEVLPQWAVAATPELGDFSVFSEAETVRNAMASHHVQTKEKAAIRYIIMPVIDAALLGQLRGVPVPVAPQAPQMTFNAGSAPA